MTLLNYTTTVGAELTASQIIATLAAAGASQILTYYSQGKPTGIAFALETPVGVRRYRLPVDPSSVEQVLRKQQVPRRYQGAAHAEKVAWRILKDWVESQLAIIETRMVSLDQVFLPYMLMGDQTVYELFAKQQLALEAAGS